MRACRGFHLIVIVLIVVGMLMGMSLQDVQAVPPATWQPTLAPSAMPWNYCGGEPQDARGLSLDLNAECKAISGTSNASAAAIRQDALGWVCKVPGQPDKAIDVNGLNTACVRQHGSGALATPIGIGPADWRCLLPQDVKRAVVPVLLFPRSKVKAAEVPHVSAALQRINLLMNRVRYFYQERAWVYMRPMSPFVLLTETSATDWRKMEGGAWTSEWLQSDYHRRVISELDQSGWN